MKKELERGRVEDEEVILIKLYKISMTTSKMTEMSFIHEVCSLSNTNKDIFKLPPHYQSLCSRGEQNAEF